MSETTAVELLARKAQELREALSKMERGGSFTADQVRSIREVAARDAGGQSALAEKLGVSPAFISGVMRGNKAPTGAVLAYLGLRKVVIYEVVK